MSVNSVCRAKDPRSCYYHGAIIEMNEAMDRITSAGKRANPKDWDVYFGARKQMENAEEERKKHQWLQEADEVNTPPASSAGRSPVYRRGSGGAATSQAKATQGKRGADRRPAATKPIVEAKVSYDNNAFPPQINYYDEKKKQAVFTRHDKTSAMPKGLMLAASRELSDDEREQALGILKYQHTISTRTSDGVKKVDEGDMVAQHTSRSVYMRTQFDESGQVEGFHSHLNELLMRGTDVRQDGTQKLPALPKDVTFALYYNS